MNSPTAKTKTKAKTTPKPSPTDIRQQLQTLRADLRQAHQQLRLGTNNNVRRPRQLKRQIARQLTLLQKLTRQEADRG